MTSKTVDTQVLRPDMRVTETRVCPSLPPGPPAEDRTSPVTSAGTSSLKRLDAIVHTGERLAKAVDVVSREELRALADRFEVNPHQATAVLRVVIKRRLLGAHGLVRESRAK